MTVEEVAECFLEELILRDELESAGRKGEPERRETWALYPAMSLIWPQTKISLLKHTAGKPYTKGTQNSKAIFLSQTFLNLDPFSSQEDLERNCSLWHLPTTVGPGILVTFIFVFEVTGENKCSLSSSAQKIIRVWEPGISLIALGFCTSWKHVSLLHPLAVYSKIKVLLWDL